jgi:4-aminobutyrate aminotransferase-like enzyme
LEALKVKHRGIVEVRGMGLMIGMELNLPIEQKRSSRTCWSKAF